MTFLLISTCENKLSELEFVLPISRLIPNSNYKILHYADCSKKILNEYEKIIICGTSLKDTSYLNKLDYFKNLFSTYEGPVLGICSGMQIIGSIFGSRIIKNVEIGMVNIQTLLVNPICKGNFQAYSLHNNSIENNQNFEIIAESKGCVQVLKHKRRNIWGVSFHPEVRNETVISNFIKL